MAGQSAKKQVASNIKILKEIHLITWISLAVFGFVAFYFRRPASSKPLILFSLPALGSLSVLEKTGRPAVDASGKIIKVGQDLTQEGITEYLFDIIYLTVFLGLLAAITGSNKVWWVYIVVPAFAGYKLWGLVSMGRQLMGGAKTRAETQAEPAEQEKSKRQMKREKRGDKPKMRYR